MKSIVLQNLCVCELMGPVIGCEDQSVYEGVILCSGTLIEVCEHFNIAAITEI